MLKKLSILVVLLISLGAMAQVPQKINYQGVVRDSDGEVLPNQSVSIRLSILSGSVSGNVEYAETQALTTNDFGLFTAVIGAGTLMGGDMDSIDWGNDTFYLKTEIDATGGSSYVLAGTSQLVSVPYALYAEKAASAAGFDVPGTYGQTMVHNGTEWVATHTIFNNIDEPNVGIGTWSPNPNAILELYSSDKGFLAPRINTLQRLNIPLGTGDFGLLFYDTDLDRFYYWDGTQWLRILAGNDIPLPGGLGKTIYHNGSAWVSGDNLYNDGTHVGIGTTTPTYHLELGADSAAKPGTNTWTIASDKRLKQNILPYTEGIQKLMQIEPVSYNYTQASGYNTNKTYVGVLAQDVRKIAPYMVGSFEKNGQEYLSLNNGAMTYMLINSVKEQQKTIEDFQKKNDLMEQRLKALEERLGQ